MSAYPSPPSRPQCKLYEPSIEQHQRGVVWVDKMGGEWGDLTENQKLAGHARRHAWQWHRDQLDKQDRGYFMHHLWPVAEMARALAIAAGLDADTVDFVEALAILHDCREDQNVTDDMLIDAGLEACCEGVEFLTKQPGENYQAYVSELVELASIEVVIVKFADNLVNSSTLDDLPYGDQARMGPKYDGVRPLLMERIARHVIGY